MVGALSVVGSSMVDSHACHCLCVDALSTTNLNYRSGEGVACKSSMGRKLSGKSTTTCSMDLGSSFTDRRRQWRLSVYSNFKKQQRKERRLVIVNELAGQYEDSFEDVKTQILNYFTYKAVRTVLNQLYEMNPTQYRWFYDFVATHKPGDGKQFIRSLVKEKQDLAERVMITRLTLYGKWVKKCNHAEMYQEISDENLALMRERLMETVIWPSDDSNPDKFG